MYHLRLHSLNETIDFYCLLAQNAAILNVYYTIEPLLCHSSRARARTIWTSSFLQYTKVHYRLVKICLLRDAVD